MKHVVVVLLIMTVITAGCGKKEEPAQKTPPPVEVKKEAENSAVNEAAGSVQQKVLAFNLEGLSDKGQKKWDVKGESAEAITESQIKIENITAKAYGDEAEATITASKGIYDKVKNNVTLQENVKAVIDATPAFAENYVNLSVTSSPEKKDPVKVETEPKKTRTEITCDGDVEFNYEQNLAYFNKNVKVVTSTGSIEADKITVSLEPQTRKISQIVADGNVKIKQGQSSTFSDKATYLEADKKVVLTGRPKLVMYDEGGGLEQKFFK